MQDTYRNPGYRTPPPATRTQPASQPDTYSAITRPATAPTSPKPARTWLAAPVGVDVADAALAEAEAEVTAPVALVSSELGMDMLFVGSTTELLPGAPVLATWWLVAVL